MDEIDVQLTKIHDYFFDIFENNICHGQFLCEDCLFGFLDQINIIIRDVLEKFIHSDEIIKGIFDRYHQNKLLVNHKTCGPYGYN